MISERRILCEGSSAPGPLHNAALPSLLRCPDGSLLLAHRIGTHKNSADGTHWLWRSRDDGATWTRVPFAIDQSGELRVATLSDIGGGQIALLLTWLDHPDDVSPLLNATTEGLLPIHIGWMTSADNGEHWTELRPMDVAAQPAGNGPLRRLPNGDLLVAFETYKHYDDPSPWSANAGIAWSSDAGRTWQTQIIAADPAHRYSYFDQHVHVLADGSLLDVLWVDDRQKPGASAVHWLRSTDNGRSWSPPAPTGLEGQYATLIELRDGRVLLFYVVRHGDSAIKIAVDYREVGVLYSQTANDLARVKNQGFTAHLQNMAQWTFGWPAAVELRDGSVLAAYYAGEGDRSSVYLARIEIAA